MPGPERCRCSGAAAAVQRGIDERWEKLEYTRDGVERKFPYCDYEIYPQSPWNYGFTSDTHFAVKENPVSETPFSTQQPPMEITAMLAPVDWPLVDGVAAMEPRSRKAQGEPRPVRMIPYGCARLRMTEMPTVE